MSFPKDFLWGAATASYQIEGAALQDGRGECIWTRFSHTAGKTQNGDTGDVACDHYHHFRDDVALMKELGLQAYRFSISWARVVPGGIGSVNTAGLDFYDQLLDELLKANIQPWATLYHWDLPQVLQDQGGWANPESPKWFANYTDVVTKRLGDRVAGWVTLNEPWCTAFLGNLIGEHAPGLHDAQTAYQVAHHLLLAHGAAMPVIRQNAPDAKAGITLNLTTYYPATDDEADIQAAKYQDNILNRWFLDPIFSGCYPDEAVEYVKPALEGINLDDAHSAMVPNDFLGVNYYMRWIVKHNAAPDASLLPPNAEFTDMGWEVYPQGMTDTLVRIHRDYHPPEIYITENGAAYSDPLPSNGIVEDPKRVDFLRGYLGAAESAIEQGVPLKGYFVWSLMDNFEWAFGYSKRFGIIHVDFPTQKRTLKRSARYYQSVIANNAL
jgi:beta-glucosidase